MMSIKVAILGAGNMGTALAQILAKRGHRVALWDYQPRTIEIMTRTRKNEEFLPGIKLSKRVAPEASMQNAIEGARLIIIACASPYIRATTKHLAHCLGSPPLKIRGDGGVMTGPIIAHVAKGLEEKTFLTMHEVVQSELPPAFRKNVVTISGPSIASELVRDIPTAVVAASQNKQASGFVQSAFNSPTFKVALSTDYRGVSVCGALKNGYAIALGMCDGYTRNNTKNGLRPDTKDHERGLPMNMKAFMLTVALHEMEKVVSALGGKRETVYGLAGIGDMIVTGFGNGRNRALGERICKDGHCKFIWQKDTPTVEGVAATKAFYELTRHKKLATPLINLVYRVLYKSADPCVSITKFFATVKL